MGRIIGSRYGVPFIVRSNHGVVKLASLDVGFTAVDGLVGAGRAEEDCVRFDADSVSIFLESADDVSVSDPLGSIVEGWPL